MIKKIYHYTDGPTFNSIIVDIANCKMFKLVNSDVSFQSLISYIDTHPVESKFINYTQSKRDFK